MSGAENDRADQAGPGTKGVNNRGAGKVNEAHLTQPATIPLPRSGDGIEQTDQNQREHHKGAELDALGNKARNDRGGGGGEGNLEEEINSRNQGTVCDHLRGYRRIKEDAFEEQPAADNGVAIHD